MSSMPFINGTRHAWGSIKTNFLGRTPTGITAISYEDSQNKTNNYGKGVFPVSRGRGRYEAKAKFTLAAYEVDAIQAALGKGERLQNIAPFDITVAYMPEGNDGLITHVIRNAEFTSNKREIKEGDTVIATEYELIVSHIDWN